MNLTADQKKQVEAWVSEGAGLAEVQTKLVELLGSPMTYMEIRFLIDDLGLELKSTESKAKNPPEKDEPVLESEKTGPGRVSVSVSKIQRPGAVVSGSVTFSDGVSADWQIDSMGRLGVIPPKDGYQPSADDLQEFQIALRQELQPQGL